MVLDLKEVFQNPDKGYQIPDISPSFILLKFPNSEKFQGWTNLEPYSKFIKMND